MGIKRWTDSTGQIRIERTSSGSITKPSAFDINATPRITINSSDPFVIMSAEIELQEPARLMLSGVINGTFHYVCGIAAYVNEVPIRTGTNNCHADCFQLVYGNGGDSYICNVPFETTTEILPVGTHRIKIGVLGRWGETTRDIYINNRNSNDMASSSSLIVRAL